MSRCASRSSDAGVGIATDEQERIFDIGVRLGDGGASGIGLALARAIVEGHGGALAVTSTPGAGRELHDRASARALARDPGLELVRAKQPPTSVVLADLERGARASDVDPRRRRDAHREAPLHRVHLDVSRLPYGDVARVIPGLRPCECERPVGGTRARAQVEPRIEKTTMLEPAVRGAAPRAASDPSAERPSHA